MRMARVNVYLPDQLAEAVKEAGLNVSGIAQAALAAELSTREADAWLDQVGGLPPTKATHAEVMRALTEARDELGDDRRG
jgi:post-segregation antitoxin (ccd killing protein)